MQIPQARRRLRRRAASFAALLLPLSLAGCPGPTDVGSGGEAWTWDALENSSRAQRPPGTQVTYQCPPNGTLHTVWGTDVYTDDSSVCTAAVHAGKISRAQGGTVTFETRAGQSSYQGTTRNGVTTLDWITPWPGSFVFP